MTEAAIRDAEIVLVEAGVLLVRLLGRPSEPGLRHLLVGPRHAGAAAQALAKTGWRYRAGHRGRHRFAKQALFAWDEGGSLWLDWRIPAGPLPARAIARLEQRVWANARPADDGVLVPDVLDALLVAAVQVARPGFPRPVWRHELVRLAGQAHDPEELAAAARDVGVAASLDLARRLVGMPAETAAPRPTLSDRAWGAGRLLQRTAGSRRVAAFLDGEPTPGHAVFRTRFAGLDVDSGSGVFLPVAFSETLVEAGMERMAGSQHPIAIDVGTGCGAVALALASTRRDAEVHGVDVSRRALRWARRNSRRLSVRNVRFHRGSLLEPVPREVCGRVDVILTNVPYVPPGHRRPRWDDMPGTIEGEDEDGLGLPRRVAAVSRDVLSPDGWLVAQIAAEQAEAFRSELAAGGYADAAVIAVRAGDAVVTARSPAP